MDEQAVTEYIMGLGGVETAEAYGYTFFFYGDDHTLPFATLSSSDSEHDRVSNLDRPGVFRLNVGVGRATFRALLGPAGDDPAAHDYAALDTIMPHPEYAAQSFVCVLSPSPATWERVRPLLAEAHARAAQRYGRRRA